MGYCDYQERNFKVIKVQISKMCTVVQVTNDFGHIFNYKTDSNKMCDMQR